MRGGGRGLPPVLAASGRDHGASDQLKATKALVLTWMLLNLSIGEARRHRAESTPTPDYPSAPSSPAAAAS